MFGLRMMARAMARRCEEPPTASGEGRGRGEGGWSREREVSAPLHHAARRTPDGFQHFPLRFGVELGNTVPPRIDHERDARNGETRLRNARRKNHVHNALLRG